MFFLSEKISAARDRVNFFTRRVKKGAQFSGFRTTQFNGILAVLIERIDKLKIKTFWQQRPEDILNKLAPVIVNEDNSACLDPEAAVNVVKAEAKKMSELFDLVSLIQRGLYHELEAIAIMGAYSSEVLDAYEGDTSLAAETQRRVAYALRMAKVADSNKKAAGSGGGGGGFRGGNRRGQRYSNNRNNYDNRDGGYDRGYDRGGYDRRDDRGGYGDRRGGDRYGGDRGM